MLLHFVDDNLIISILLYYEKSGSAYYEKPFPYNIGKMHEHKLYDYIFISDLYSIMEKSMTSFLVSMLCIQVDIPTLGLESQLWV